MIELLASAIEIILLQYKCIVNILYTLNIYNVMYRFIVVV